MRQPSSLEMHFLNLCREIGLPEPTCEYRFCSRMWRLDAAWPAFKVGVEVAGGTWIRGKHSRGKGQTNDACKMNMLQFMGWAVFTFTSDMLNAGPPALALLEMTLKERSKTT